MAIYDWNGTTTHEIGKLYDNDGTTNYQIGKVYDNNGTTDSLIYQLATPFTLINYGSGIAPSDYYYYYPGWIGSISSDGSYGGYRFTMNAMDKSVGFRWNTPRDLSGLTKATITIPRNKMGAGVYFGVAKSSNVDVTTINTGIFDKYISVGTGTFTLDISALEGNYYIKMNFGNNAGDYNDYMVVHTIKFE